MKTRLWAGLEGPDEGTRDEAATSGRHVPSPARAAFAPVVALAGVGVALCAVGVAGVWAAGDAGGGDAGPV
ncbi:MAG: hypothetical protein M3Q48_02925, partial [Actinomycetota bacterium]|nr:hypothetical protein [Actinomycetota bacterium]